MIELRFCRVEFTAEGADTHFPDGTVCGAQAHDTHHYAIIAARCGYGDDTLAYCREHELAHSLVAQWRYDAPSAVLWGVAHDAQLTGRMSAAEETLAQTMQRFWRANERPILSGLPQLDAWKAEALAMIAAENDRLDKL